MNAQPIAPRLASFAITAGRMQIPEEARQRARLHLIDVLGCGLAAVGMDVGGAPAVLAGAQGGRAEATLIGGTGLTPAPLAAFANGTPVSRARL